MTLPAGHAGAHVDYGYARTVDTAQGATVDHSLFAPSTSATAERAYVALSRGRFTNRIYATSDRSWLHSIGQPGSHALAIDQSPGVNRELSGSLRPRIPCRERERHTPFEIGL